MADRIRLPYIELFLDEVEGEPGWSFGSDGRPYVRCGCGSWLGIETHVVTDEGFVSPSLWHHPEKMAGGCGWHFFVDLEGYPDRRRAR